GAVERLAAGSPDWVSEKRAEGFELYQKLDMPDPRAEEWRYVELDFDLSEFMVPEQPGAELTADSELEGTFGDLAGRAVVIDGHCVDISSEGVSAFVSTKTAIADHPTVARQVIGRGIPPDLDRFSAAHHAFGSDGVFLHVPANTTVEAPYFIDVQATTPGTVTFPRISILVEENADAAVVVHFRSPQGTILVVPQIEADVAGRLSLTSVQEWGPQTTGISQLRMAAERDASLHLGEVGLGGALARLHLTMELNGRGSTGEVSGLYFGDSDQVLDYRAFMNHRAPNTNSDMFLKGAVEDDADSVFTGLIRIESEAQRVNAYQTNRNLVLSDGAEAQSVPNLEILANDVKCGHASTVGPLDEEQRYYLMSRGLERSRADRLQVRGFFEEAIKRLPTQALAAPVRQRVNAKYIAAQEEGRV
ncbi:MAG: Fe-S cluster assembly protein SufD, partial [Acidimicrobiia bacterium]|nr:Fe-S cluster assembly protein SufD [Acidimicrobiia bacterium]